LAPRAEAWVHVKFARREFAAGHSAAAKQDLQRALEIDPGLAQARRPLLLESLLGAEMVGQPAQAGSAAPVLNGSRFIASSIQSCLAQTFGDFELIVVDGGSTDNTLEIVRSVADARVRIVRQTDNSGRLPGALNRGFAEARGEFFTWTQDDDYYAPEALHVMVDALRASPDLGFVYTGFWYMDADGQVLRPADVRPPEGLYQHNVIGHCFLYRRSVAERVGQYDPAFFMSEDTHFWVRVFRVARMQLLPGRYFYHRLHPDNLTGRNYGAYAALKVSARARRQILHISWLEYQRQVSRAYIEEAFAAHARADAGHVWPCVVQGLVRDPRWLANRGVLAIALRAWRRPAAPRRPES
jgi:GT2 family glycosyltransferase